MENREESHYTCHPSKEYNRNCPGEDKQVDKAFTRVTPYSHHFRVENKFNGEKLQVSSNLLPKVEEEIRNGNHHPQKLGSENHKNTAFYLNDIPTEESRKHSSFLSSSWDSFNSLSLLRMKEDSGNKYRENQIIAKTRADPSRDNFNKSSSSSFFPFTSDKKLESVFVPGRGGEEDESDTISSTCAASTAITAIKHYFLKAPICPWNQILSNIFKTWIIVILLAIQIVSPATILAGVQGADLSSSTTVTPEGLECYVCLPGDKSSHEAKEILKLFPLEGNHSIPDCIAFDSHNAHQFQFTCPPPHNLGCSRQMGTDLSLVSRSCVNFRVNDCKIANGAEYCWCTGTLCNGVKELPTIGVPSNLDSSSTSDYNKNDGSESWKDLTDDEDLLGPNDPYEQSGEGPDGGQEASTPDNNSNTPRPRSGHTSRNGGTHQRKFFAGSNPPASHNNVPPSTAAGVPRAFKISYSSSVPTILISLILPALLLLPRSFSL